MSESVKERWQIGTVIGGAISVAMTMVLGVFGWVGRDYLSEFRGDIATIAAEMRALNEKVQDHEVRITSRQADRFTAQDGLKLEARISENRLLFGQQAKADAEFKLRLRGDVEELKADVDKLTAGMQRVWQEVRKR